MTRAFWLTASLAFALALIAGPVAPNAHAQIVYLPGGDTPPAPKDTTLTIRVRPLAPGVFAARVNHVWTGWVETSEGILLIDATWADSSAAALADTIAARSPGKTVRYLVLTHDHTDHFGGARRFLDAGAVLVAHGKEMAEIDSVLGRKPGKDDIGIAKKPRRIGKGENAADVMWLGRPAHSGGDVMVLVPQRKILFAGDLVWNNSVPWLLDRNMNLKGWNAALDSLYAMRASIDSIVPGHGDIAPPVPAIRFTLSYLRDANEKAAKVAAGRTPVRAVRDWGDLGAYQGLEFYEEVHFMNIRRLYNEARGIKTPGRIRVGTYRE